MKALLIYPTHTNGREVEQQYAGSGIDAACYPGRATADSAATPQNCWSDIADQAEAFGFPVVKTVCPSCRHRKTCLQGGYLGQLSAVKQADVVVATHKRAELSGLNKLATGCEYVSIHENPIDLLRPQMTITEADLNQVQYILNRILNDPAFLDWFGDVMRFDDDGQPYEDEELAIRKERLYDFCTLLADILDDLAVQLRNADVTTEWSTQSSLERPVGIERTLFYATRKLKVSFMNPCWRFILAIAAGELHSAAIIVDRQYRKGGGQGVTYSAKSLIGISNNVPPPTTVMWFNDATIEPDRLESILNHSVRDETPDGYLALQRKAVQIPRDVTRGMSKRIVSSILRGVMIDRPQFCQVGIIGHRPHVEALDMLGQEFTSRIVKSTYFGSGDDRSSNDWHHQCDLLIVVGTPRLPPGAIAQYLVQVGEIGAACHQPEWGMVSWHGRTESGEPVKITTSGYQDAAWQRAHRDLVRAQIVQAIGRGRGILATGCEVIVLSNEECGLEISDAGAEPFNDSARQVLLAVRELGAQNSNKYYLENCAPKSADIASHAGLGSRQTQAQLTHLERRGLVRKVGERSGWLPVITVAEETASCASAQRE